MSNESYGIGAGASVNAGSGSNAVLDGLALGLFGVSASELVTIQDVAGSVYSFPPHAVVYLSNGARVAASKAQAAIHATGARVLHVISAGLGEITSSALEMGLALAKVGMQSFLPSLGNSLGISTPIVVGVLLIVAVLFLRY